MFRENKNLNIKDTSSPSPLQGEGWGEVGHKKLESMSYTKTHKLITALYMVTDIIDKDEPLRNKLRTLGTEIISDIYLIQYDISENAMSLMIGRISETMSFLDLASSLNIISEMNCSILKKEFLELNKAVQKLNPNNRDMSRKVNLVEFFREEEEVDKFNSPHPLPTSPLLRGRGTLKGHTRIGVQKGSTLLKALSDKTIGLSDMSIKDTKINVFEILKKQRRDDITNIIQINGGNTTIKDIKDKIKLSPEQASFLVSCSEKTLQRELVSMVKDGVLNKNGEKRWSKYFLKN